MRVGRIVTRVSAALSVLIWGHMMMATAQTGGERVSAIDRGVQFVVPEG